MNAREQMSGVESLVRDAQRVVTLALIERPHPQYDSVSQAIEILAERGMVITPSEADAHREAAEQLAMLWQVIDLVLLHDAAGEAIDCDRLRVALRDTGLNPEDADAPDFFRPGRTYHLGGPFQAPELCLIFRCVAIAQHPTAKARRAFGFERTGEPGSPWRSAALRDEEWEQGWDPAPAGAVSES